MPKGFPVVVNNFQNKPASMVDILSQDGTYVSGNIGSGVYTGLATVVNTNIIQGNASEVGGFNLYIRTITINSTKDADFIVRINQGAGFLGTVPATADREFRAKVKAGVTYILEINAVIVWGANIFLFAEKFGDTTGNANVTFQHDSIKFFQNTNVYRNNILMGIGDSIMKGVGSSYTSTQPYLSHYALLFKKYRNLGLDIKPVNKGVPGAIIEDIAALTRWGYYDNSTNVEMIYFSIGTNVSPSNESFTSALNEILDYFQAEYPNAIKLICAPIARLDIKELTVAQYRPLIQAAVDARKVSDPTMFYLNLSLAFDSADPQFGIVMGDYNTGVGGNVHPNNLGHAAIYTYVNNFINTNNIKIG